MHGLAGANMQKNEEHLNPGAANRGNGMGANAGTDRAGIHVVLECSVRVVIKESKEEGPHPEQKSAQAVTEW